MDHVFHNAGEVKEELGLPLLGHIPVEFFKESVKTSLPLQELDKSVTSGEDRGAAKSADINVSSIEAFRNLYTSIRFLNSDQPLQSVALTGSTRRRQVPGERVAGQNALGDGSTGTTDRRQLRKPQMHMRLGLNNLSGLSNVLTEANKAGTMPFRPCLDMTTGACSPPDAVRQIPPVYSAPTECARLSMNLSDQGSSI